jgi:uncharacterized protein
MINNLRNRLRHIVQELMSLDDGSHDLAHFERVERTAFLIAADEPDVDHDVLLAAVWLHDVVAVEKDDPRRSLASKMAADKAVEILSGWGWPADKCAAVHHAVEAHSFSAGIPPRSIEAMILRDADRLDSLGAIGIARTFYVSGRLKKRLYDPADPCAEHRALNDRDYALDHFPAKLLTLADGMLTAKGRELAAERTAFLAEFQARILQELTVDS